MKTDIDSIKNELEKTRDTLKLRAHLLNGEMQHLWNNTELKWLEFEQKYNNFKDTAQDSGKDISTALNLLKEQISESYDRLKNSVQ